MFLGTRFEVVRGRGGERARGQAKGTEGDRGGEGRSGVPKKTTDLARKTREGAKPNAQESEGIRRVRGLRLNKENNER